ncbi:MAG TPA: phosphatidylcholine/phosphatidylserine synthase [Pyrinomonadaceae bacterium]|jgi:CDP-diacylglycerol--serine O-phosphatidyltransferase|nr:phosphatidylcholine/phosphatidylserine synthase [Pyrinomonadaceae bacterium]
MSDTESPNPERRGLKKGLYLIPSAFTAANIGMGFFTVMSSLRAFQLIAMGDVSRATAYLDNGAKAIGWALLFDMLDGRIARMTKTTTEIGVQLDSLADVVTFGIAPAVLAYVWGYGASLNEGSDLYNVALFISFMYLMCGTFRLARFNVQSSRPRILAEGTIKMDKKSFVGLPIPVAGGLVAALVHFAPTPLVTYERAQLYSLLMIILMGVLSVLMVSTMRFSSFKTVGTKSRSMRTIILAVGVGVLIFLFSRYVLLGIVISYILYGLLSRMGGLFRRRSDLSGASVPAKES